jgi:uncharacterized protein (TIGR04255 family)
MGVEGSAVFGKLDNSPLARSPIVSVVWQLRFEEHPDLIAPQTILRFRQILGEDQFSLTMLPRLQVSVQAGTAENMARPATTGAGGGWRLSAVDGSWQISAESNSIGIDANRYGTWDDDFIPRLERVIGALKEVGAPVIQSRIGLRYVNVLVGAAVQKPAMAAPSELAGLVAPWLLGPLSEPTLRDAVQVSQGRALFSFENTAANLIHGIISTETKELGYLIDIDVFREHGQALNADDIVAQSSALNELALGLFQMSVTEEALDAMRSRSDEVAR